MYGSNHILSGLIKRSDNNTPIHGLCVEAWALLIKSWKDKVLCKVCLGNDLTNRDGSFAIAGPNGDLIISFDESMFEDYASVLVNGKTSRR